MGWNIFDPNQKSYQCVYFHLTPSILLNKTLDSSSNLVWLPFSFWTILVSSMIQAKWKEVRSAGEVNFLKHF